MVDMSSEVRFPFKSAAAGIVKSDVHVLVCMGYDSSSTQCRAAT